MSPRVEYLGGKVIVHAGDCLDVLPTLAPESIDSIVTDPPYHLTNNAGTRSPYPGQYTPIGKPKAPKGGFMGKQWDGGDIAFQPELWSEVLRVLKPGGHLLAFSGSRTYHRMACAIEDAGFEVRDQIMYLYGSGFPKSLDVSKAIDKAAGFQRGTTQDFRNGPNTNPLTKADKFGGGYIGQVDIDSGPVTDAARQWQGFGTSLKPAHEPLVLARKPLSEPTVAANVLRHGTGAINVGGCRVGTGEDKGVWPITQRRHSDVTWTVQPVETDVSKGRFPANLIHDGSDEVEEAFAAFGERRSSGGGGNRRNGGSMFGLGADGGRSDQFDDTGTASRFFYTSKADQDSRLGSKHPTVKPLDLIQYLVRLITPPGGLVLDPFAGTGTTAEAAFREGMRAVLIEREPEYQSDIARRMELVLAGPDQKRHAIVKARGKVEDAGPLFGAAV